MDISVIIHVDLLLSRMHLSYKKDSYLISVLRYLEMIYLYIYIHAR